MPLDRAGRLRGHDGRMTAAPTAPARVPSDTARLRIGGAALPLLAPARVYVCGITPYDVTHLGHAATFVWADAAAAVMRLAGVPVVSCRNVTDVDDVLTRAARARDRDYDEFALGQEFLFGQDMASLRVRRPTHEPRARHHVGAVIALADALLAVDAAYVRGGTVHFRGADAVRRSGLAREDALAALRAHADEHGAELDDGREDAADVPVWRPSGAGDPGWPSPWGRGRPGWHAECAAMATEVLGHGVDLLVGGSDLTFPHHAYQAAMAEAASGIGPFARAALPVGTVRVGGEKMAKSTGNLVLVGDILPLEGEAALRLFLLDRRWDASWDWRPGDLVAARSRLEELYRAAGRPGGPAAGVDAVRDALLDDLDVPTAVTVATAAGGEAARLLVKTLALG